MSDVLRDLLLNGYMIYPKNGKFAVKKEAVPNNIKKIEESFYDTYDLAINAAEEMLMSPEIIEWNLVVRYNRGLGIEYRNLPNIHSSSFEKAQIMAEQLAKEIFKDDSQLIEIKVRPKNAF